MIKLFITMFTYLMGSVFSRVLLGAGLSLTVGTAIHTFIVNYINNYVSQLSSVSSNLLSFAGLAGFDVYISSLLGAVVARSLINSSKVFLTK